MKPRRIVGIVSLLQRVHRTDSILVYNRDRVDKVQPQQVVNNQYLEEFRNESISVLSNMIVNVKK